MLKQTILSFVLLLTASHALEHDGEDAVNRPDFSRAECEEQGVIVGDIGNGAIHRDDYICDSNGQPPIGNVVPQEGEPIAIEGEVCCGLNVINTTDLMPTYTQEECLDLDGVIVQDNGASLPSRQGSFFCPESGNPPIARITGDTSEMCCATGNSTLPGGFESLPPGFLRPEQSRQECEESGGTIVGDIGNGAIFQDDYICESNGEPPVSNIVPQAGEPFAIEGEVCCGPSSSAASRNELSRSECEDIGIVVGDIGDGSTQADDYMCDSDGEPPLANVVSSPGEPISSEFEVCCGIDSNSSDSSDDGSSAVSLNYRSFVSIVAFVFGTWAFAI